MDLALTQQIETDTNGPWEQLWQRAEQEQKVGETEFRGKTHEYAVINSRDYSDEQVTEYAERVEASYGRNVVFDNDTRQRINRSFIPENIPDPYHDIVAHHELAEAAFEDMNRDTFYETVSPREKHGEGCLEEHHFLFTQSEIPTEEYLTWREDALDIGRYYNRAIPGFNEVTEHLDPVERGELFYQALQNAGHREWLDIGNDDIVLSRIHENRYVLADDNGKAIVELPDGSLESVEATFRRLAETEPNAVEAVYTAVDDRVDTKSGGLRDNRNITDARTAYNKLVLSSAYDEANNFASKHLIDHEHSFEKIWEEMLREKQYDQAQEAKQAVDVTIPDHRRFFILDSIAQEYMKEAIGVLQYGDESHSIDTDRFEQAIELIQTFPGLKEDDTFVFGRIKELLQDQTWKHNPVDIGRDEGKRYAERLGITL